MIFYAAVIVVGMALALWAAHLRDWLARMYNHPSVTAHLHMRGYVTSMRLVGLGLTALSVAGIVAFLHGNH